MAISKMQNAPRRVPLHIQDAGFETLPMLHKRATKGSSQGHGFPVAGAHEIHPITIPCHLTEVADTKSSMGILLILLAENGHEWLGYG